MTVAETAAFYGVTPAAIRRELRKGRFGYVRGEKIGRVWHVWSGNERRARERAEKRGA